MLTVTDVKFLLKYFSDNYIICQFRNGESLFTELHLKSDIYVDDVNIQHPRPVGDETDTINLHRDDEE